MIKTKYNPALLAFISISLDAYADFNLCNISSTQPISVAWAYQSGALIKSNYSVGGWKHVGPGRCEQLAYGDVANNKIWVLAISNGVIIPPGTRPQGSRIWLSDQKFCVSDKDFEYSGDDNSATLDCKAGYYLSTFPVSTWFGNDVGDFRLEMNPDEFTSLTEKPAGNSRGPALPDVHGALATSSTNMYYASLFSNTQVEARQAAINHCRSSQPGEDCKIEADIKNQCVAVVTGNSRDFINYGEVNWSEQQTLDFSIKKCNEADGPGCKSVLSGCSTWAARSAALNSRDAEAQKQILNNMSEALQKIFQR